MSKYPSLDFEESALLSDLRKRVDYDRAIRVVRKSDGSAVELRLTEAELKQLDAMVKKYALNRSELLSL